MGAKRKLPPTPDLVELVSKGMTPSEIGAAYGTTGEAVRKHLNNYRQKARVTLPWDVQKHHKQGWLYESVWIYVCRRDKIQPLDPRAESKLREFLDWFSHNREWSVVDYDPSSIEGLFVRCPRQGDLRRNCVQIRLLR